MPSVGRNQGRRQSQLPSTHVSSSAGRSIHHSDDKEDEEEQEQVVATASRKFPAFISKSSAFIGRVAGVRRVTGAQHIIWLSESSLLAVSILPGSLVSVSLAASSSVGLNAFPLYHLSGERCGIKDGDVIADKPGSFFALAVVQICKVLDNGVILSEELSVTMGCPPMRSIAVVSPVESRTVFQTQFLTIKSSESELPAITFYECKDIYLRIILSNTRPSDCFGNEMVDVPAKETDKMVSNSCKLSAKTPYLHQMKLDTYYNSSIEITLQDKQCAQLLKNNILWLLSGRVLLCGNIITVPLFWGRYKFLVEEATTLAGKCYQEKELKNNLSLPCHADVAFLVVPGTKVHFLPSLPEKVDEVITGIKLGGLLKELEELKAIILSKVHHHANYTGVLLHGPSGTGKTSLVRSCAQEVGVKLFSVSGPEIIGLGHVKGDQALCKVFDEASLEASALVFIDELDVIAPGRKYGGDTFCHRLLNLLDVRKDGSVLVIAAAIQLDDIDPLLRCHGRFDRVIEIGVPSQEQRLDILSTLLNDMNHSLTNEELKGIALKTHGFVGSDLVSLCNEAAFTCLQRYIEVKNFDTISITTDQNKCNISCRIIDTMVHMKDENLIRPSQFSVSLECLGKRSKEVGFINNGLFGGNEGETVVKKTQLLNISIMDFEKALLTVKASTMQEVKLEVPKVSWEDIGGQEEVKRKLREVVEWPQTRQNEFEDLGVHPQKGVLLYGPPGCSKTLMARAVASNAGLNFFSVKGPELLNKWVGESEKAVKSLFKKARDAAPSVIFFDEIDGLAVIRGKDSDGTSVGDRVMSQLLSELDGARGRGNVTVIAATNRPDKIDPALLRKGRFDRLLYVAPPNERDREAIFRIHMRGVPCSSDVKFDELARLTNGYTGADIFSICQNASYAALEEDVNTLVVSMAHFKTAISIVQPSRIQLYKEFFERFACRDNLTDGCKPMDCHKIFKVLQKKIGKQRMTFCMVLACYLLMHILSFSPQNWHTDVFPS